MQPFHFRLERVRRIREHLEDRAQRDWSQARDHAQLQHQALQRLESERSDAAAFGYGQMDLELRTAMYQYISVLDRRIAQQRTVVSEADAREETARQRWIEARQDRESLDKLKEKQYEEHSAERLRQEQNLLDDAAKNAQSL